MDEREEKAGLVADTYILISALLSDHSTNGRLIESGYFAVYLPEYGLMVMEGYRDYIKDKREKSARICPDIYSKVCSNYSPGYISS